MEYLQLIQTLNILRGSGGAHSDADDAASPAPPPLHCFDASALPRDHCVRAAEGTGWVQRTAVWRDSNGARAVASSCRREEKGVEAIMAHARFVGCGNCARRFLVACSSPVSESEGEGSSCIPKVVEEREMYCCKECYWSVVLDAGNVRLLSEEKKRCLLEKMESRAVTDEAARRAGMAVAGTDRAGMEVDGEGGVGGECREGHALFAYDMETFFCR